MEIGPISFKTNIWSRLVSPRNETRNTRFVILILMTKYAAKNAMTCFKGFCSSLHFLASFLGGPERTRTAVGAFAELCLATRPPDHSNFKFQILSRSLSG